MNIYQELGVEPVINAAGTVTILGGSLMPPEVVEAMVSASQSYIDIHDLHEAAGRRIAELVGVDAAHVCACASAGITLMAAACMSGPDLNHIAQLPDTTGLPNRFIVQRAHHNGFNHAIEVAGGKLVEIDSTVQALRAALEEEDIAAVMYAHAWFFTEPALPLKEAAQIAHDHGKPLILDAAAEVPPMENLSRFVHEGADLVTFSGGKDICGPQSSGFIVGKSSLVACCAANDSPNVNSIARGMKTGKEEIAGLVKAVELYVQQNPVARMAGLENAIAVLISELSGVEGIHVERQMPPGQGQLVPHVMVTWDEQTTGMTCAEMVAELRRGKPAIAARLVNIHAKPVLWFCVQTLRDGEAFVVAHKFKQIWQEHTV